MSTTLNFRAAVLMLIIGLSCAAPRHYERTASKPEASGQSATSALAGSTASDISADLENLVTLRSTASSGASLRGLRDLIHAGQAQRLPPFDGLAKGGSDAQPYRYYETFETGYNLAVLLDESAYARNVPVMAPSEQIAYGREAASIRAAIERDPDFAGRLQGTIDVLKQIEAHAFPPRAVPATVGQVIIQVTETATAGPQSVLTLKSHFLLLGFWTGIAIMTIELFKVDPARVQHETRGFFWSGGAQLEAFFRSSPLVEPQHRAIAAPVSAILQRFLTVQRDGRKKDDIIRLVAWFNDEQPVFAIFAASHLSAL